MSLYHPEPANVDLLVISQLQNMAGEVLQSLIWLIEVNYT